MGRQVKKTAGLNRVIITVLLLFLPPAALTQHYYDGPYPDSLVYRRMDVRRSSRVPNCHLKRHSPRSSPSPKDWGHLTNESFSQWQSLGPEGGYITSMVMHPNNPSTIHASSYTYPCLIHRTTNGGENWAFMGTIDGWINCLAVGFDSLAVLYASTWGEYVYKSTDAGLNWTDYRTNTDSNYIYALGLDPTNPNTVWGAADLREEHDFFMAVAKSADQGSTWSFTLLASRGWGAGFSVAVDPTDSRIVYVGGYYYDEGYNARPALFKTTGGGLHWDEISPDVDSLGVTGYVYTVAIDPTNPHNIYAGGNYRDEHWNDFYLLKSTDGGSHWTPLGSDIASPVRSLVVDPSFPDILYVGTYEEVFKSVNGGLSWSSTGGGIIGQNIRSLLLSPVSSFTLYAGNEAGIFRTTDGGLNWLPSSSGLVATRICALATPFSSPDVIYACVENDALYKSTDSGINWTRLHEFSGCHGVEALVVDPQDVNKIYLFTGG